MDSRVRGNDSGEGGILSAKITAAGEIPIYIGMVKNDGGEAGVLRESLEFSRIFFAKNDEGGRVLYNGGMQTPVDVVVLAAGRGSRLRTDMPKPLLPLAGEPLIAHVLAAAEKLRPRNMVVVVPSGDEAVRNAAREYSVRNIAFAVQLKPNGTADAARCGAEKVAADGIVLILCADAPLISVESLRRLKNAAKTRPALLSFYAENPAGYGRIVRNQKIVAAIVEEKDARGDVCAIREVFAGAIAAPAKWCRQNLARIRASRGGEMYLTDLAALAFAQNNAACTVPVAAAEAAGINTFSELARAENEIRRRRTAALMAQGVRVADPARTDLRGNVRAGRDSEIDINTVLQNVVLARGVKIGAHCVITDCRIGADARIEPFCHLHGATIGARCTVGPFARIRPQTQMQTGAHVGNFVELKNARLGAGVKAGHLAYLGDAEIGANANIGAGVISCNYDGRRKHKTVIGADSFVGSDTQLIAPVRVGRGAYIAAGTTLTKDAPPDALTWSRIPQTSRKKR